MGGGNVFGQVEVMHAQASRYRGHADRGVERQRIEHGICAAEQPGAILGLVRVADTHGDAFRHALEMGGLAVDQGHAVVAAVMQHDRDGAADLARAQHDHAHRRLPRRARGGGGRSDGTWVAGLGGECRGLGVLSSLVQMAGWNFVGHDVPRGSRMEVP